MVAGISESLNGRMTNLEAKMQSQWETFEQKWEDETVQLEAGSKEGSVFVAKYRIPTSVQAEMEKLWTKRMEKEDKIMLNKYGTLNPTVERLGNEIINLRVRKKGNREHRGRFVWERREHKQFRSPCHFECVHTGSCGIERLACLAEHSVN